MTVPRYHARPTELSWREIDGEVVLLNERDWTYLHLNGSGALLWRALIDGAGIPELVASLVDEYGIEASVAQADVEALLADLTARGLAELR